MLRALAGKYSFIPLISGICGLGRNPRIERMSSFPSFVTRWLDLDFFSILLFSVASALFSNPRFEDCFSPVIKNRQTLAMKNLWWDSEINCLPKLMLCSSIIAEFILLNPLRKVKLITFLKKALKSLTQTLSLIKIV